MKKYVLSTIPFVMAIGFGVLIGYFFTPTKIETKTIENQADKKTIADLQQQLKTKTKVQIKYVDGIISSKTIDTDTTIDTNQKTVENEKISQKSSEKVEINPKKYIIGVGYGTNKAYFVDSFLPVFGAVGLTGVISSNFRNSTSFGLGIAFSF